jgi:hypothetical protein
VISVDEVLRLQAEPEPHNNAQCGLNRTTSSQGSICE